MRLSRRHLLAGLISTTATAACGGAPTTSPRPYYRDPDNNKSRLPTGDDIVVRTGLSGEVAFVVADAATGEVLEARLPDKGMPPASTAKALTTMWALDRLGPQYRYQTRLLATGPVVNGRIQGDLILAGGGDPVLDTDMLASMAQALKDRGVREVGGRLKVWTGALPTIHEIDAEQPDHVGYNPALCGLNLNFNRVHFAWERNGGNYSVSMDARSGRYRPDVTLARMQVVDRGAPIYTYDRGSQVDQWTVARHALGNAGSRWLPVRHPGLYAGEVFQTLARSLGIVSGGGVEIADRPEGEVLHVHQSDALPPLLLDMLKYSNNLTAEVMGLTASSTQGQVGSLKQSAGRMNDWFRRQHGLRNVALVDHSGLGDDSRVTAADMARAMVLSRPDGPLKPLMKPFNVEDSRFTVSAKTGTLNFVSALAGYVDGPSGRPLAFAIFCGDIPRRDALTMDQRERPDGGRGWNAAAKGLQRQLLERWGTVYTT